MLLGTFPHSLDVKGRFNFPAKLREGLGSKFFITRGLDGCLFVYPENEWRIMEAKINALPLSKARNLQRFFFSGAADVEPDKQGRILIPTHLREHAKLDKDILIVGASVRAEIWNKEIWEEKDKEITDQSVLETMDEIGI